MSTEYKKKDIEKVNISVFKKAIKALFRIYDTDESGSLDMIEFRILLNEVRKSLFLPEIDDFIFERALYIIDKNMDGFVSCKELIRNIKKIYPVLLECGKKLEKEQEIEFKKLDSFRRGYLKNEELLPQFITICEKENFDDCKQWQIDYIISLFDDNANGALELVELIENYGFIVKELSKFCSKEAQEGSSSSENYDEEKLIKKKIELTKINIFKKIENNINNKNQKKKIKELLKLKEQAGDVANINDFAANNAKEILPVNLQINNNNRMVEAYKKRDNINKKKEKKESRRNTIRLNNLEMDNPRKSIMKSMKTKEKNSIDSVKTLLSRVASVRTVQVLELDEEGNVTIQNKSKRNSFVINSPDNLSINFKEKSRRNSIAVNGQDKVNSNKDIYSKEKSRRNTLGVSGLEKMSQKISSSGLDVNNNINDGRVTIDFKKKIETTASLRYNPVSRIKQNMYTQQSAKTIKDSQYKIQKLRDCQEKISSISSQGSNTPQKNMGNAFEFPNKPSFKKSNHTIKHSNTIPSDPKTNSKKSELQQNKEESNKPDSKNKTETQYLSVNTYVEDSVVRNNQLDDIFSVQSSKTQNKSKGKQSIDHKSVNNAEDNDIFEGSKNIQLDDAFGVEESPLASPRKKPESKKVPSGKIDAFFRGLTKQATMAEDYLFKDNKPAVNELKTLVGEFRTFVDRSEENSVDELIKETRAKISEIVKKYTPDEDNQKNTKKKDKEEKEFKVDAKKSLQQIEDFLYRMELFPSFEKKKRFCFTYFDGFNKKMMVDIAKSSKILQKSYVKITDNISKFISALRFYLKHKADLDELRKTTVDKLRHKTVTPNYPKNSEFSLEDNCNVKPSKSEIDYKKFIDSKTKSKWNLDKSDTPRLKLTTPNKTLINSTDKVKRAVSSINYTTKDPEDKFSQIDTKKNNTISQGNEDQNVDSKNNFKINFFKKKRAKKQNDLGPDDIDKIVSDLRNLSQKNRTVMSNSHNYPPVNKNYYENRNKLKHSLNEKIAKSQLMSKF